MKFSIKQKYKFVEYKLSIRNQSKAYKIICKKGQTSQRNNNNNISFYTINTMQCMQEANQKRNNDNITINSFLSSFAFFYVFDRHFSTFNRSILFFSSNFAWKFLFILIQYHASKFKVHVKNFKLHFCWEILVVLFHFRKYLLYLEAITIINSYSYYYNCFANIFILFVQYQLNPMIFISMIFIFMIFISMTFISMALIYNFLIFCQTICYDSIFTQFYSKNDCLFSFMFCLFLMNYLLGFIIFRLLATNINLSVKSYDCPISFHRYQLTYLKHLRIFLAIQIQTKVINYLIMTKCFNCSYYLYFLRLFRQYKYALFSLNNFMLINLAAILFLFSIVNQKDQFCNFLVFKILFQALIKFPRNFYLRFVEVRSMYSLFLQDFLYVSGISDPKIQSDITSLHLNKDQLYYFPFLFCLLLIIFLMNLFPEKVFASKFYLVYYYSMDDDSSSKKCRKEVNYMNSPCNLILLKVALMQLSQYKR